MFNKNILLKSISTIYNDNMLIIVVCLPGAKIEAITERVENIVGSGKCLLAWGQNRGDN